METLKEQIVALQSKMLPNISLEALEVMLQATQDLKTSGIEDNSLKSGDKVHEFVLPNYDGSERKLSDYLKKGHLVLSFYRGSWCPYCNLELAALQARLPEINDLGAQLVAISPEMADLSNTFVEQRGLVFDVLYDKGNRVAESFGLLMTLPEALKPLYANFGIDLPKHNADNSFTLPLPATYVINNHGEVVGVFVDADYTKRMEPEDIIRVLERVAS